MKSFVKMHVLLALNQLFMNEDTIHAVWMLCFWMWNSNSTGR